MVGYIEMKQLNNNINISVQRGKKTTREDGRLEMKLESAFAVFDNIKNTGRYWSKARMELIARLYNIGPFNFFFSLSSADYRNQENFTSLLQDQHITYMYDKGEEVAMINGLTIEEFLDTNSSAHEFIRRNTNTATRNFDHRVKSFIKNIVMNSCGPLCAKDYSYRVEFQMRGEFLVNK